MFHEPILRVDIPYQPGTKKQQGKITVQYHYPFSIFIAAIIAIMTGAILYAVHAFATSLLDLHQKPGQGAIFVQIIVLFGFFLILYTLFAWIEARTVENSHRQKGKLVRNVPTIPDIQADIDKKSPRYPLLVSFFILTALALLAEGFSYVRLHSIRSIPIAFMLIISFVCFWPYIHFAGRYLSTFVRRPERTSIADFSKYPFWSDDANR